MTPLTAKYRRKLRRAQLASSSNHTPDERGMYNAIMSWLENWRLYYDSPEVAVDDLLINVQTWTGRWLNPDGGHHV